METAGYEKNRMYIGGSQSFIFRIFVSTWLNTFASWSLQDRDSIILEKEGYAVPALFPHNSEVVIIFGSPLDSEGIFCLCVLYGIVLTAGAVPGCSGSIVGAFATCWWDGWGGPSSEHPSLTAAHLRMDSGMRNYVITSIS